MLKNMHVGVHGGDIMYKTTIKQPALCVEGGAAVPSGPPVENRV